MIYSRHHLPFTTATSAVLLLLLVACGPTATEKKANIAPGKTKPFSAAEWLAKDSIGIFRGAEFGDEAGTIRQMESDSSLVFSSPNLLQYEYTLPGERHYKVDYTFKNNQLSSLNFDIFLADETEAERLNGEFKALFTHRFGEEVEEMGIFVWPIPTGGAYMEAYLELKDESSEFGYGKLNLTAYAIR